LARRPRSIARFSTLLALNSQTSVFRLEEIFKKVKNGYPPLISYTKSESLDRELILCDPMAGGGSIPLESVLLGMKTIAFDYNPIAYLILKGCVEYPLKFKKELSDAVKEEARKMIRYAQLNLEEFYRKQDDAIYSQKALVVLHVKESYF
jgi:adenine-specific DNA methylase